MSYVMVDIEADGPIPGDYSMISFGAVLIDIGPLAVVTGKAKLETTFFGKMRPISDKFVPEALAVSGYSREETMTFPEPLTVMKNFDQWLNKYNRDRPMFISDNNGFDWMFMCWYFWHFLDANPFGHSSTNLGSFYKGVEKSMKRSFKHLRKTRHSHDPVDDARGNAEAFCTILQTFHIEY
jgi:hypothetical protein